MREIADAGRIRRFMRVFGAAAQVPTRVYFTGGATAVLLGWRTSTIDVDIKVEPDTDALFRAIPGDQGPTSFHHFEPYAQALAKVERGHRQDLEDVREMLTRGLIEAAGAWGYFSSIEPHLFRYPALDPGSFRLAVWEMFGPRQV